MDSRHLFTVRCAVEDDIPALSYHRAAMFRDMGTIDAEQQPALERATAEYLRSALPRGDYLAWVVVDARNPASIIGGAGAQLRSILPRPHADPARQDLELGPEAIVLNVYVQPAWRRRGIAETLMREVLQSLAARGVRRVVLHASDEGRRLYERLGFVPTNEMQLSASE